mgnify:CR=1 FL=1
MVKQYDEDCIPTVYNIDEIPSNQKGPGTAQKYFRGIDSLIGLTELTADRDPTEQHAHPWEQLCFVLDGQGEFEVGGETVEVEAGDLFLVPPGVPHAAKAPKDELSILFFGPLREDYAELTGYQAEF